MISRPSFRGRSQRYLHSPNALRPRIQAAVRLVEDRELRLQHRQLEESQLASFRHPRNLRSHNVARTGIHLQLLHLGSQFIRNSRIGIVLRPLCDRADEHWLPHDAKSPPSHTRYTHRTLKGHEDASPRTTISLHLEQIDAIERD